MPRAASIATTQAKSRGADVVPDEVVAPMPEVCELLTPKLYHTATTTPYVSISATVEDLGPPYLGADG